jgi:hypothetical protein
VFKKKEEEALRLKTDSFVVYPNFFIIPTLSITYRYRACS